MTIVRPRRSLLALACLLGACRVFGPQPGADAYAVITRDSAYFVFPPESVAQLTWNTPEAGKSSSVPDRTWLVGWEPVALGTDSTVLVLVTRDYHPSEPVQHGTLAELLAQTRGEEGSVCWRCEPPGSRNRAFAAIRAAAHENHVVLVVSGRTAIEHLFWSHPRRIVLQWSGSAYREVPVHYK